MAPVSRREFLQYGGASAALTFMVANGIRLDAAPLGLPIGTQMWPHRMKIANKWEGLAAVFKDLKATGLDTVEMISPSGEFQTFTDGSVHDLSQTRYG